MYLNPFLTYRVIFQPLDAMWNTVLPSGDLCSLPLVPRSRNIVMRPQGYVRPQRYHFDFYVSVIGCIFTK